MAVTIMTRKIDWSLDFRDNATLDGWCKAYDVGVLLDAPIVRQYIGALSHVWINGMGTLLRQCQDLLRQRKCDRQAMMIDGIEKSVFSLGDVVKLLDDGMIGRKTDESVVFPPDFLDTTYCTLSYGENDATMLCWSQSEVSYEMICLCDAYGLDISIMPETRYGKVYDVVGRYEKRSQQ